MMGYFGLAILLLLLLPVVPVQAGIGVRLEREVSVSEEFPVPRPYPGTVEWQYKDANGDGTLDVICLHPDSLGFFSIEGDSSLGLFTFPSGISLRRYDWGSWNGTGRISVVEGVIFQNIVADDRFALILHSDPATSDTLFVAENDPGDTTAWLDFFLRDLDSDGTPELYGRYSRSVITSTDAWGNPFYTTTKISFSYSFASSTFQFETAIPAQPLNLIELDGSAYMGELSVWSYYQYVRVPGGLDWAEGDVFVDVLRTDGTKLRWHQGPSLPCPYECVYNMLYDKHVSLLGYTHGDIVLSHAGREVLLYTRDYFDSWFGCDEQCDSSSNALICLNVSNPDAIDVIYRIEPIVTPFNPHIYFLPAFPGSYFDAVSGTDFLVTQHDGLSSEAVATASLAGVNSSVILGVMSIREGDSSFFVLRNARRLQFLAVTPDTPSDIDDNQSALPTSFTLSEPYPNPFNPSVSFAITLAVKTDLTVRVYNALGQEVDQIFSGVLPAGERTFVWDASDRPSGVYFIKAATTEATLTRKAVLVK